MEFGLANKCISSLSTSWSNHHKCCHLWHKRKQFSSEHGLQEVMTLTNTESQTVLFLFDLFGNFQAFSLALIYL